MLRNIEITLADLLPIFNGRKPAVFAEVARREFQACFVKAGQKQMKPTPSSRKRGLLDFANDWEMQVDFKDRNLVFPPIICATDLRPDIVLWSGLARSSCWN